MNVQFSPMGPPLLLHFFFPVPLATADIVVIRLLILPHCWLKSIILAGTVLGFYSQRDNTPPLLLLLLLLLTDGSMGKETDRQAEGR